MEVFREAFAQSEGAVKTILDGMLKVQSSVSEKLSPYAPLIMNIDVPEDMIRVII